MYDMEYDNFKQLLVEKLMDYMPSEFSNYYLEAQATTTEKNEMLLIKNEDVSDELLKLFLPEINLRKLYEKYISEPDQNFSAVCKSVADVFSDSFEKMESFRQHFSEEIRMTLVNNETDVSNLIHRNVHDFYVVYYLEEETGNFLPNEVVDVLNLTEKQIFQLAFENLKKEETKIISLSEFSENVSNDFRIITTGKEMYGAAKAILDEELLQALAEKLENDLYILPSSVHEAIICSAGHTDISPNDLSHIINEVNQTLDVQDRLSDNVYYFDRSIRSVSKITEFKPDHVDTLTVYDIKSGNELMNMKLEIACGAISNSDIEILNELNKQYAGSFYELVDENGILLSRDDVSENLGNKINDIVDSEQSPLIMNKHTI